MIGKLGVGSYSVILYFLIFQRQGKNMDVDSPIYCINYLMLYYEHSGEAEVSV